MADMLPVPFEPKALSLFSSTLNRYRAGWKVLPAYGRATSLIYVLRGAGTYSVNGELYPLKAGECFLVSSGALRALLPVKEAPFHIRVFRFDILDPALNQRLQLVSQTIPADSTLKSMLTYMINNWSSRDADVKRRVEAFSLAILNLFLIEQLPIAPTESSLVLTEGYSPATKKLLPYLEKSAFAEGDSNSLESLGQTFGYNKNYLSSVFSKDTGYSIPNYLHLIRMRVACIYFFFYQISVSEICELFCYSSLSYFNYVFKRFVGISPRDFSKACSKLNEEERSLVASTEPTLNYYAKPINEQFAALRHLGETMKDVLQRKTQGDS